MRVDPGDAIPLSFYKKMIRSSSMVAVTFGVLISSLPAGVEDIDDIKSLVAALNEDGGWWQNGLFTPVSLPGNAKVEEIIVAALKTHPEDSPFQARRKVIEARKVTANRKPFVAVHLEYPDQTVIVMCEFLDDKSWWCRFTPLPIKIEEQNKPEMATPRKSPD